MIIDTHCHAGINWFEPIENLIFQMDKNSVDKAVLIQHKGSTNNYLYECLNRFSNKFSIVTAVNWNENLENQLKEFKNNGASGIRVYLDFPEIFNAFDLKQKDFFLDKGTAAISDQLPDGKFYRTVTKKDRTDRIKKGLSEFNDLEIPATIISKGLKDNNLNFQPKEPLLKKIKAQKTNINKEIINDAIDKLNFLKLKIESRILNDL